MCMPLGPRYGAPGRSAYLTLSNLRSQDERESALQQYPDNNKALGLIKEYIDHNIDHTEKWIIYHLILSNRSLAYIFAEGDNRTELHKYYLAQREALKVQK